MNLTPDMERKNQRTLDIALLAFMTLIYLCGLAASVLRLFQVIPGAVPGLLTWGLLTAGFSLCLCGLIRCIQGKEEKLTLKTALWIEYPCLILAALSAVMQHLNGQTLSRRKIAVLVGLVLLVLFHTVKYFSSKKSRSTPPSSP